MYKAAAKGLVREFEKAFGGFWVWEYSRGHLWLISPGKVIDYHLPLLQRAAVKAGLPESRIVKYSTPDDTSRRRFLSHLAVPEEFLKDECFMQNVRRTFFEPVEPDVPFFDLPTGVAPLQD